jgi:hypothetical protein
VRQATTRLRGRVCGLVDPAFCHQRPDDWAILLASATRTSIGGFRASMRAIQDPASAPLRAAQRGTVLAPMVSRRRKVRSPIFEVTPSSCLPPVECCLGVSKTQAAKSCPRLNVSAGGANAVSPTPGTVINRRAVFLFGRWAISRSSRTTSSRACSVSIRS